MVSLKMSSLCLKTTKIALEPFFPQLAEKWRQNIKPGTAVGGNGHITALVLYNKSQCFALSGFAPLKPKYKTGRKYYRTVIQTSLLYRMATYPTRNLQIQI